MMLHLKQILHSMESEDVSHKLEREESWTILITISIYEWVYLGKTAKNFRRDTSPLTWDSKPPLFPMRSRICNHHTMAYLGPGV